jgi:hypothetical protein
VSLSSLTTNGGTISSTNTTFETGNVDFNGGTTGTIEALGVTGNFGSNSTVFVQFGNLTLQDATANPTGINASGGSSTINLVNSSWTSTFLAFNVEVSLDGTSSLTHTGAGDPINSQGGEATRVNLVNGSQLTLASVAEFTEQGDEIFIDGVAFNDDPSLLVFEGNTATAVPEPSTGFLVALAGLVLLRRQR